MRRETASRSFDQLSWQFLDVSDAGGRLALVMGRRPRVRAVHHRRMTGVEPRDFVRRLHPELPRLADLYVLLHRTQVMRREAAAACAPAPEPR